MARYVFRWICCFCLIFFYSTSIWGQQNGKLIGKLTVSDKPIAFASLLLYASKDSIKPIANTNSDSIGVFEFNSLSLGKYRLIIRSIGVQPKNIDLTISQENPIQNLGVLSLISSGETLKSVTVTSEKKLIQRTSQGFVVNASASITQLGGTATDLLRNTPTVLVDAEGAITMRGKSPMILINGRNSSITNTDQIAASSIESIEIINSPGANYDADAEGGIINIKLKKGKQSGTNGALAVGAGFGAKGRVNSSFLLNHKTEKWNLGLAYDNRFAGRDRTIDGLRTNFNSPDQYQIRQFRFDDRLESLQNLRLSADYAPSKNTSIGFEANFNKEGQDNNETLTSTTTTSSNKFNSKSQRQSIEIARSNIAEYASNVSYKSPSSGALLTANMSIAFNKDKENTDINSINLAENGSQIGSTFYQKTHNYEDVVFTNLKADYSYPLSDHSKIETGYKGVIRSLDADFQSYDLINGIYVPNAKASNIFQFHEQVHAVYAQMSSSVGEKGNPRFKYDIGLRGELIQNNGKTISQNVAFDNNYFKLFPSVSLVFYNNPEQFWKLGYNRRINRPGLGQLNPFMDITDSLNQHGGNPYLKPELVNAFELGFSKEWSNYSFYSALFYRNATNAIREQTIVQPNGVAIRTPVNFGNATTYGLENIFTAKPFKVYDFNLSLTLFKQQYSGENVNTDLVTDVVSWNGKFINNFQIWTSGKLQITGIYNSPIAAPQGERLANYNIDMGFQQKLGKGNSRLGLVVTDIFNTLQNGSNTYGSNFSGYRISKSDTRAVMLTFALTFGTSFKEKLMENKFSIE